MKRLSIIPLVLLLLFNSAIAFGASDNNMLGINVLLRENVTDQLLSDLARFGKVRDVIPEIKAVTMQTRAANLDAIRQLPYVLAANPDATRTGAPIDTVPVEDFANGLSTWDLDAINVTDFGFNNRQVAFDGSGVYVAVLDTGLVDSWRQYFPEERIATQYAISFGGGGGEMGWVSTQPNK